MNTELITVAWDDLLHVAASVYGNHIVDLDSELVKLDAEGSRLLRAPASSPSLQGDTHAEHR